jgi:hypothetical protein
MNGGRTMNLLAWIPDKLRIIELQLKDHLEKTGKPNIVYAPLGLSFYRLLNLPVNW